MNREKVETLLAGVLHPDVFNVWWDTPVPAFDRKTPNEMWLINRILVWDLVESYLDPSFS